MTDTQTKTTKATAERIDEDVREVAPIDAGVMTAISRAELDNAITTARAYPRSVKRFMNECLELCTLNEQVAEECIYALPRDGKVISGPSVRMAEIVSSAWGNCRAGARVVDEGATFLTAQGVFHDLEKNVHITMEVRRRITTKSGRRYGDDMIATTGNAACSIALRNAVFRGIPKALWSPVFEQAKQAAIGNVQTLANKRDKALQHMQKLGVTQEAVLATLGVAGVEDIGIDELATLRGLANAIKDGEVSPEQAFAPPKAPEADSKPKKGMAGLAERVAGGDADDEQPQSGGEVQP